MRRIIPSIGLATLATLVVACTSEEPTRRVQWGQGMLDMVISQSWQLEADDEEGRVFTHGDLRGVTLHVTGETERFGHPLRVTDVKTMLGKELNLEYGGVSSRVSFGGNAMIKYVRELEDEDDQPIHCEEWVLAKPVGYGDFARVEISLRMSPEKRSRPEVQALIDALDKRVGDATIPRA